MPVSRQPAQVGSDNRFGRQGDPVLPSHRTCSRCYDVSTVCEPRGDLPSPGAVEQQARAVAEPCHQMRRVRHHGLIRSPPGQLHRAACHRHDRRIMVQQHHLGAHDTRPVVHQPSGGSRPPPARRETTAKPQGKRTYRAAVLQAHDVSGFAPRHPLFSTVGIQETGAVQTGISNRPVR
ncbi:hypothetical protein SMALA_8534 [Streptomyces malaysiensis subsp. malaysiensis]|nr:hypothetical protein SMALA_8534 [Streptomyces malaysiensis]